MEDYVSFGFLVRVGVLPDFEDMYRKYNDSKVFFKESEEGRIIQNKEEVWSWYSKEGYSDRRPKCLEEYV